MVRRVGICILNGGFWEELVTGVVDVSCKECRVWGRCGFAKD